jgi:hypothetical protein
MTAASRSLATVPMGARFASALLRRATSRAGTQTARGAMRIARSAPSPCAPRRARERGFPSSVPFASQGAVTRFRARIIITPAEWLRPHVAQRETDRAVIAIGGRRP